MNHFILKRLLIGFFFVLICSVIGLANPNESIQERTAEMLGRLTEIDRADFQHSETEALILEIFSNKKNQKKAEPLLNDFFLKEKNIAGKRYFMDQLAKAGTPAAVNYLAVLLTFDPSAELALMTLQDIQGEQVNKLLGKSFGKAPSGVKPGIINALGLRGDEKSVSFISKYIDDNDSVMVAAAAYALGKIGTPEATATLTSALKKAGSRDQLMLSEALLEIAEQHIEKNQLERALEIYDTVRSVNPPAMIALAAIKGKMETDPGNAVDILKQELTGGPDELKPGLVDLVSTLPESYRSGKELLQLSGIPDNEKVRLMVVLAERKDKSIRDEVIKFLEHEEAAYREAAILSLAKIAGVESVPLLAEMSSSGSEKEQELARRGIYRLAGRDIDSFILEKAVDSKNESLQAEYIRAIGERNMSSAGQVLIRTAKDENRDVRLEAYRSLAKVGSADQLGEIVELLLNVESSRERQELERSVVLIATRKGREYPKTGDIVSWLNKTSDSEKKETLVSLLGSLKNPDDLEVLKKYLYADDADLQLSAIRALSEWPNAGPAEDLKQIIKESDDLRIKILALRGFTQVIVNDSNLSDNKKANELLFAMSQAPNVNEKKLMISALGKVPSPESLRLLIDQMADVENPRPELEAAIISMAPQLLKVNRNRTLEELNRALEYTENEQIRELVK